MFDFVSRAAGVTDWAAVDVSRGGAVADVTAATAAAAADLSWPPVTSVADALGATLTG